MQIQRLPREQREVSGWGGGIGEVPGAQKKAPVKGEGGIYNGNTDKIPLNPPFSKGDFTNDTY